MVSTRGAARIAVAAVAAAVLAGAGGALALPYVTGGFRGTTGQHLRIAFHAGRSTVTRLRYRERGTCSDGSSTHGAQGPSSGPIVRSRFDLRGTSPSGATTQRVKGRLVGRTASGTLRVD